MVGVVSVAVLLSSVIVSSSLRTYNQTSSAGVQLGVDPGDDAEAVSIILQRVADGHPIRDVLKVGQLRYAIDMLREIDRNTRRVLDRRGGELYADTALASLTMMANARTVARRASAAFAVLVPKAATDEIEIEISSLARELEAIATDHAQRPSRPGSLALGVGAAFDARAAALSVGAVDPPLDWSNSVLAFLHIPKAGGSSIKGMIIEWSRLVGCASAGHRTDVLALTPALQESMCIAWGHRGYGLHQQPRWRATKEVRYMTFLREPLARAVSEFEWLSRDEFPTFTSFFRGVRKDVAVSPWKIDGSPNVQQLCCWYTYHTDWVEERSQTHCGPSTEETLECAKANLNTFVMVGLTEHMDMSTELLSHLTGIPDLRASTHVNRGSASKKHVLTDAERAMAMVGLRFDLELYAFARVRFRRDVLRMREAQRQRLQ